METANIMEYLRCGMKGGLTNTVFLVPMELFTRRTHTLVTARCVNAAVFTAAIINAALVNICHTVCVSDCDFSYLKE